MKKYCFLLILIFMASACSNDEQASSPSLSLAKEATAQTLAKTVDAAESPNHKLLVFVNPNGGPCILQNKIIADMTDELRGKVVVQHIQTTVPSDLNIFHHYGIRALPTLLLADANGKEVKRMAPGVKNAIDIRALLQSISQS